MIARTPAATTQDLLPDLDGRMREKRCGERFLDDSALETEANRQHNTVVGLVLAAVSHYATARFAASRGDDAPYIPIDNE
jgi:hypothetical protein